MATSTIINLPTTPAVNLSDVFPVDQSPSGIPSTRRASISQLIVAIPYATPTTLGTVIPGAGLSILNGVLSVVANTVGPQGIPGTTGLQGISGIQGIQGIPGVIGATGLQGIPGTNGTGAGTPIPGPMGPPGPQGIPGTAGNIGPQGPTGLTGGAGSQGIQGVPGTTGLTGGVGSQGPVGSQGAQGPAGTNATNPITRVVTATTDSPSSTDNRGVIAYNAGSTVTINDIGTYYIYSAIQGSTVALNFIPGVNVIMYIGGVSTTGFTTSYMGAVARIITKGNGTVFISGDVIATNAGIILVDDVNGNILVDDVTGNTILAG